MLTKTLTRDKILKILKDHSDEISEYGVVRLGLFGSYVRGEQKKDSDIDIVVEYNEGKKVSIISCTWPFISKKF